MFTVDYKRDCVNLPVLRCFYNLVNYDAEFKKAEFRLVDGLYQVADNLEGLVILQSFGNYAIRREGILNTDDTDDVAIVKVICNNWGQYFKLPWLQKQMVDTDIIWFKVARFDDREIYYIPCENTPAAKQYVIEKLVSDYTIEDILAIIEPGGNIKLLNI